jgi:hypothetical protein
VGLGTLPGCRALERVKGAMTIRWGKLNGPSRHRLKRGPTSVRGIALSVLTFVVALSIHSPIGGTNWRLHLRNSVDELVMADG